MAIYLSDERLGELGKTYLIGDLRFVASPQEVAAPTRRIPSRWSDVDGRPLGDSSSGRRRSPARRCSTA